MAAQIHNMKDTHHIYYPTAGRMNITPEDSEQRKPRMQLDLAHNQFISIPAENGTATATLQPTRCTICKDSDGNTLFYRPSMALHTLYRIQDNDDNSASPAKYSNKRYPFETVDTNNNNSCSKNVSGRQGDLNSLDNNVRNPCKDGNGNNDNNQDDDDVVVDDDDSNTIHYNASNHIGDKDNANSSQDMDDDDELQRLVIPKHRQCYVTLYDAINGHPLWSLIEQDWHTMTLLSRQLPHKYILMTTSTFSFIWETPVLASPVSPSSSSTTSSASTTATARPSHFQSLYQWRMQMSEDGKAMDLICEQCQVDQSKKPIALLTEGATRLVFFGGENDMSLEDNRSGAYHHHHQSSLTATTIMETDTSESDSTKNPFRSMPTKNGQPRRKLNTLDTFLILSSLLLHDLIGSQLHALGGGTDAIMMMMERQRQALTKETVAYSKQCQLQLQQHQFQLSTTMMTRTTMENDELDTVHVNSSQYYSHQDMGIGLHSGLNNVGGGQYVGEDDISILDDGRGDHSHRHLHDNNHIDHQPRWSSNGSMKSLELDPGLWQCWWGYGCWWSWFPCCMPGGWCDRAWIKVRGVRRQHHHRQQHHRSRVTRRMQGWQQQQE